MAQELKYDIFISYSRKDAAIVDKVVSKLEAAGFSIWIDKVGIYSGDAFKSVIVNAIENSDTVLFFSSESSNASPWTTKEIAVAIYKHKRVIPIRLDDSSFNAEIMFDLVNLDYIDLPNRTAIDDCLKRLIKTLGNKQQPPTNITNPSEDKNSQQQQIADADELLNMKQQKDGRSSGALNRLIKKPKKILNIPAESSQHKLEEDVVVNADSVKTYNSVAKESIAKTENKDNSIDNTDVHTPEKRAIKKYDKERLFQTIKRIIKPKVAICASVISLILICVIIAFRCYRNQYNNSCIALMDVIIQDVDTLKYVQINTECVVLSDCGLLDEDEYKLLRNVILSNDYNSSVPEIREKAERGDDFSQFCLYNIYIEGDGVAKDTTEAEKWLNKSADQFYPLALYVSYGFSIWSSENDDWGKKRRFLKTLVENGSISHQGPYGYCLYNCGNLYFSEAEQWLTKAANNGDAKAMNNLGCMFYNGDCVNKDNNMAMAINWFTKAAENGNKEAQYNLGNICFTNGNYSEAVDWYNRAAKNGCSYAFLNLAIIYDKGIGVEANKKLAIKYLEDNNNNNTNACVYLGMLYYTIENYSAAENRFSLNAGELDLLYGNHGQYYGDSISNYNLGIMYEHGNGATQDLSLAVQRFEKAYVKGCSDAYLKLIKFYMHGTGIGKDYDRAFSLCREAALKGDVKAQTILGLMYNNGWGCQSNTNEGLRWTKAAAQKKHPAALYSLGLCYKYGIGVGKDKELSQLYFNEAQALGFLVDE